MTFTSWQFGAFGIVVLALYYLPQMKRLQVQLLVAASLFFYGYGEPVLLSLLAVAVFGTHLFLWLSFDNRRLWLPLGITFNLALLAFFKYKLLFVDPAAPKLSSSPLLDYLLHLPLPIGISFFVFHNISLLVDLSKRLDRPPPLKDVFLYIIFFPQLVSGPITRAENFIPQIKPKVWADVPLIEAVKWIVVGYFFKLYVANNLNVMTSFMDFPNYQMLSRSDKWVMVGLYSAQIYADFFGYSSIAVGLALMFGYRLPINFDLPYTSRSFSEFWTRWHISLSSWLRTYLYIPLGGNRRGPLRTYVNLIIVMGLGGLWHGAGLSYLTWGLMHGLLLVLERPLLPRIQSPQPIVRALRAIFVLTCVSLLWIFFKLPDFTHATGYVVGMFEKNTSPHQSHIVYSLALLYSAPVIIQHVLPTDAILKRIGMRTEPVWYGLMAALAYLEAGPDSAFIYFQF
ncbi:MBOAT family O-acyltransferase [Bradyrhizobium japonicum]|uniref:MBOAT family O-acyltransferase n=1 Tax=Bradyrhizobium japonicum TaxID=375 RepID=UPI0004061A4C|nr:MBOAT family O-acyltransferase [Bradyrhizobium japonicum]MCP1738206.1 alginate O-acetyltransferase complex protein AlgI [Bradyrhizobium japonicum]MCP1855990.1 alginate O-acetyltransferase complex protein AlgI [Bradyrhizobium japonicum]MCP1897195.1 alginate O-acetyltransferase complex protein AlgI [Bradyrhizobium japonicum]MCW2330757.1 alginate O-acetyltransferase complex protein AlgI [Bradyrhizobium japonicum]WLB96026.1 MBOAT family O-acyltransferase [Bradyrhizobium japonicum USDA 123]